MTNYDILKEYEAHKEPFPSYEEYQDIIQQNVNQEAAIETYIEQILLLEKRLKIATKALKKYMTFCRHPAEETLEEMEGVK